MSDAATVRDPLHDSKLRGLIARVPIDANGMGLTQLPDRGPPS